LNVRRRALPDIDLDLPSDRRDEVIDWVLRRFGKDRAAMVSAHVRFRRRSAWREGLKALGMALPDVERFCRMIPEEQDAEPAAPPLRRSGFPSGPGSDGPGSDAGSPPERRPD